MKAVNKTSGKKALKSLNAIKKQRTANKKKTMKCYKRVWERKSEREGGRKRGREWKIEPTRAWRTEATGQSSQILRRRVKTRQPGPTEATIRSRKNDTVDDVLIARGMRDWESKRENLTDRRLSPRGPVVVRMRSMTLQICQSFAGLWAQWVSRSVLFSTVNYANYAKTRNGK